jgi:hypothetical protein
MLETTSTVVRKRKRSIAREEKGMDIQWKVNKIRPNHQRRQRSKADQRDQVPTAAPRSNTGYCKVTTSRQPNSVLAISATREQILSWMQKMALRSKRSDFQRKVKKS